MLDFLPQKLLKQLKKIEYKRLYEIKIRQNAPVKVVHDGKVSLLKNVCLTQNEILEIVVCACKRSIYSYEEQIKNGFISSDYGERIGLCGEFVIKDNKIHTIKNFTSLTIRVPNEVVGFSKDFYEKVYKGGSVLVFSKTGVGKTTFIRDIANNICANEKYNCVIVDERNEIANKNLKTAFNLLSFADVLTYASKDYAFLQAVRTLNPTHIITDEIVTENDANGVLRAFFSGINVIATVHADVISKISNVKILENLIRNHCFNYYVNIVDENGYRRLYIYGKNMELLCSF